MLKAKLDSVRKNKKGFSLVELIIVIAIMVALIAVMAPSFVKYVQKSRNSALASAAESLYTAIQTYYGDPDETPAAFDDGKKGTVTVKTASSGSAAIVLEWTGISDSAKIVTLAGVDTAKKMGAAEDMYTITITKSTSGGEYTFSMVKTTRS